MTYNPEFYHRRSIRLKDYDYSQTGAYFVTMCTKDKGWLFGDVINGEMQFNNMGTMAQRCWNEIPKHFPDVVIDEFIIMPNHIHGIVIFPVGAKNILPILTDGGRTYDKTRAQHFSPLRGTSMTIGSVIRGFKIGVTKWARDNGTCYAVWQRNYYEHIIRSEPELHKIREYIANNPLNWETDENYKR